MPSKQRMRLANEKASKNVEKRGNVSKSSVSIRVLDQQVSTRKRMAPLVHVKMYGKA